MTTNAVSSVKIAKDGRKMSPNSLANLKPPYPPGVSGNEGSGNGYSLLAELKHALNKQKRKELVDSTIEGAILREPAPFHEVWDRIEGKVPDPAKPQQEQGNRIINIFVGTDRGREMIQGLADRLEIDAESKND